jgi:tetratricopeptide (TPR) repeat protein
MVAATLVCAASDGLECNAKALQLYRAAHYAEAEAMYRRALDAFDRAGEGDGLNRALTLENIAVMLRAQGRYAESEKDNQAALPKIEELTGRASLATVRAVSNLAALYWSWGKLEQAESLAMRAEVAFQDFPEANHADRSSNRQILASIYLAQHRYADAGELLRATLEGGDGLQQPGRGGIGRGRQCARRRVRPSGRRSGAGRPACAASADRGGTQQSRSGVPLPGQVSGG